MNKNVKILIIEDEVIIAEYIREFLINEGFKNIEASYDCKTALDLINTFEPNILLVDINIEEKDSGIEIAKKRNPLTKLIYITAQNDDATMLKAIKTNPINYLTKPIRKIELLAAIKLASTSTKKNYIIKKDGHKEVKILLEDIMFIKSDGNYIDIQTTSKKFVIRQALEDIFQELDSETFCKTHRSYIINKNKITSKTSTSVFINTTEIPLSRSYTLNL